MRKKPHIWQEFEDEIIKSMYQTHTSNWIAENRMPHVTGVQIRNRAYSLGLSAGDKRRIAAYRVYRPDYSKICEKIRLDPIYRLATCEAWT